MFLSSVSQSSKLLKLRKGWVMGTEDLQLVGEYRWQPGMATSMSSEGRPLEDGALYLWGLS